jgi:tetratricopeptide (TPR) repeat protein
MKFLIKKNYIIILFLILLSISTNVFAKDTIERYSQENISNYFIGIVSISQNDNEKAFKQLNKIKKIKDKHSQYNIEFLKTLVLTEKFKKAFIFSKKIQKEHEVFFEADLLLGINFFLKKDYENAEIYFKKLNKISEYNLYFDNFIGNSLIAWVRAIQGKKDESFKYIQKIPSPYKNLKEIQNVLLQCYFDDKTTQRSYEQLTENQSYDFSRYNYFRVNYLLSKKKINKAREILQKSTNKNNSNLLLKQSNYFLLAKKNEKINSFFDCKNPEDSVAELFYIIANLYAADEEYRMSNFYINISMLFNEKFSTNKALLAENFLMQKKYKKSKDIYSSLKSIGPIYSWFASKNIAGIILDEKDKKYSINSLQKDFDLLKEKNFENYYDLANFYKDNGYYKESIKYYSLVLKKIKKNHYLAPKVLDRRGTSFERLNEWEKAEKDLLESLRILPDQANVLNYLAYTWVDKGINLDKGLVMLKKANEIKKNDGYIIDSLGWAYYAKKNYIKAKYFLQEAAELLPTDPVINDHYGDSLWMLNKDIQARHIWSQVLQLDETNDDLRKKIKNKIIFGIIK